MKRKDILTFSLYDLRSKPRFRRRMTMGIGVIELVLILWFIILLGFNWLYRILDTSDISAISLVGYANFENGEVVQPSVLQAVDKYPDRFTGESFVWGEIDIPTYLKRDDWLFANMKYVTLQCENRTFQGINDYSYDFDKDSETEYRESQYTVPFYLCVAKSGMWLGNNDLAEYRQTYSDYYENGIVLGKSTPGQGELVISDYMLAKFGIEEDEFSSLIGKEISISCDGMTLFENRKLVGIVDNRLFYLDGLKGMPQVILGGADEELASWEIPYVTIRLPIRSYDDEKWLIPKMYLGDYGTYHFTATFTIESLELISQIKNVALGLLKTFGVFVFITLLLGLICLMANDVKNRSFFYGMLKMCGMRNKEICMLHLYEMGIIFLNGFMVGTCGASALFVFTQGFLYRILSDMTEKISVICYVKGAALGGAVGFVLFICIELVLVVRCLRRKTIRTL